MKRLLCYLYLLLSLVQTHRLVAQSTQTLSGRVLGFHTNRAGDYDGFQLRTSTGTIWLRFPPHTAAQVLKQTPVGKTVRVTAAEQPLPLPAETAEPVFQLINVQLTSTKRELLLSSLPPPAPAQGKLIKEESALMGELHDDAGRLSALLTDRHVIELKPHQGESVQALLVGVDRLGVVGYERVEPGFINKTGRKLIHPTALIINNQTYAL
ncbi:hypothetical protein [Spirosoma rhododendri]|uniref:Uncharacterized protein n=1 Tax=Spirosoma rhododendri TaxID=2728024 RepID=A0A7L5DLX5_9BACT|nr:hypothetical protein [Spirosoma rhododendri]QJD78522.1 hypothetical protein HH216_08860 [Spirosoma rhododendri]